MQTMPSFDKAPIFNIAEQCAQHGLTNFVISPGSRSAPLTAALAQHPAITCRVVMDERAAAFIALGISQQSRRPVGLVCTSGTAGLNYAPAVAEAYYQQVPLLVFTADRPPEWIDQQDGQTIRQTDLYGAHILASFQTPVDYAHPDAQWHLVRIISEAINLAQWPSLGPVHINLPLREPLYPPPGSPIASSRPPKLIQTLRPHMRVSDQDWTALLSTWQQSPKKLILGGLYPYQAGLSQALSHLQQDPSVVALADLTGNLHPGAMRYHHWDMILSAKSSQIREALRPNLLITFGGQIVSKVLKQVLRQYKPQAHWHIAPSGKVIDTFQSLTTVLTVDPADFFADLGQRVSESDSLSTIEAYTTLWQPRETKAHGELDTFLAEASFGEFVAVQQVLQALPEPSFLQLGNSMPVRYANYLGLAGLQIQVNANRGTSGIDGVVSTAVGAALTTNQITTVLTGDLAFFYDRNALWHNHLPPNLRIVILNNQGGGIFKLIDGPSNLPATTLAQFFETPHALTAKNTAADYGCDYYFCDNTVDLDTCLLDFFTPKTAPAILEIKTNREQNTAIFKAFKQMMANL